jgi:UDP:flavonoid glycosyltransferase YjiC (YdhE family)
MARIVISTAGTVGDVVPFAALGKALQTSGHDVAIAVNPAMHTLVQKAGLLAATCGPPFGPDDARQPPALPASLRHSTLELKRWEAILRDTPSKCDDLLGVCAGADLLVAHSLHYAAALVHERLGLPWVAVSLLPGQFQHNEYPITSPAALAANLNLLASSRHFSAVDQWRYPDLTLTGFWFFDCADDEWQPTVVQRQFVESDDAPVVLCLGCLPGPDTSAVVAAHVQACAALGKKLVVQTGWAGEHDIPLPPGCDRRRVLLAPFLTHEWLFTQAAAVCHHGGIGVTARALRLGCPTLVLPYLKEQMFHAAVTMALGVGCAMHPGKLTADGLVRVLSERILVPAVRRQAQARARLVQAENGVATACMLIESLLRSPCSRLSPQRS